MRTKRIINIVLSLIIVSITSISAQTVGSTFETEGIVYKVISNDSVEVSYKESKYSGEITIPETVTNQDKVFSVTNIGNYAFEYCEALTNVIIPNSVTNIGTGAFYDCTGLTNVTIPNSVTNIEGEAFQGCSKLPSVIIPNSVITIGNYAFEYCEVLTSVSIPNSVTNIGKGAFSYCKKLGAIIIPNSVENIEDNAFEYCESLKSATISKSVTKIGEGVFGYCKKLEAINIDTENPNYADIDGVLYNKDKTTLLLLPTNSPIQDYTIPNSVTKIGNIALNGCVNLTNVTIPNSVKSIGDWAFRGCGQLTSIIIPNSVTNIGNAVFSYCKKLVKIKVNGDNPNYIDIDGILYNKDKTELIQLPISNPIQDYTIPNSVTKIGNLALSGCTGLTSVIIPKSVVNIGGYAFENCTGLSSITSQIMELSEVTMGDAVFEGVVKTSCTLYVPKGKINEYNDPWRFQWSLFPSIKEIKSDDTAINEVESTKSIFLYPVLADEKVTINISSLLLEQIKSATLFNSSSKMMRTIPINGNQTTIDITPYVPGIYFIKINNYIRKFIIQ